MMSDFGAMPRGEIASGVLLSSNQLLSTAHGSTRSFDVDDTECIKTKAATSDTTAPENSGR